MITRQIINHEGVAYIIKYKRSLPTDTSQDKLEALKAFYGADTVMTTQPGVFLFLEKIEEAVIVEEE